MAGHATTIDVTIGTDSMVTVVDDGRGVPVGKHSTGKDALEVVHTVLHAGGKFGGGGYKVSGGLHGVGVSVVNALSEWMRVESAATAVVLARSTRAASRRRRSRRSDRPATPRDDDRVPADPEMFETTEYSFDRSRSACASRRTSRRASGSRSATSGSIASARSTSRAASSSFVRHLNRNKESAPQPADLLRARDGSTMVEVALQYNDSYTENVLAFANNINTVDGGTHVTGFRAALTSSLNDWAARPGS
jgi:DNA gyrase subunit B